MSEADADIFTAPPADNVPLKLVVIALDKFLGFIAPASFAIIAWYTFCGSDALGLCRLSSPSSRFPKPLLYAVIEVLFFFYYLYRRRKALDDEQILLAPADSERERLFSRVLESLETKEQAKTFIRSWFHEKTASRWSGGGRRIELDDLLADNVKELLAAAFFNETLESVRARSEHSGALDRYLRIFETTMSHKFSPGYNPDVASIRQMLEQIPIEHRPFAFYLATFAAGWFAAGILRIAGFRRYRLIAPLVSAERRGRKKREGQAFEYFYSPRIAEAKGLLALLWKRLSRRQMSTRSNKLPIVFSAGLAGTTGCFHAALYLLFTSDRPVFLIGLPAVSLRLKEVGTRPRTASDVFDQDEFGEEILWRPINISRHESVRPSLPSLDLQARGLRLMLDKHGGHGAAISAIFVSHSLGTSLMSFAARMDPQLVAANILVDPIVFDIFHSRLVKTFLYKRPQVVGEHFIRLFSLRFSPSCGIHSERTLQREIGISCVISRAFFWHQVASFVKPAHSTLPYKNDTVDTTKTFVILSSEDVLVPSRAIARQLAKGHVRYTLLEGAAHAGFLVSPFLFRTVMDIIEREAERADKSTSPILFSRPSFARGKSSTGPLTNRRSRSGSLLSPVLMTSMTSDPMPITRQLSPVDTTGLPGLRRRPSAVMGSSYVSPL